MPTVTVVVSLGCLKSSPCTSFGFLLRIQGLVVDSRWVAVALVSNGGLSAGPPLLNHLVVSPSCSALWTNQSILFLHRSVDHLISSRT